MLPVLFIVMHAVVLEPMPIYLDDTGFLELYRKLGWDTLSIFSYNFDTYKFYRVLGFDLNYLYYRFFVEHFDLAILLISALYFAVVDGYIRTFRRIYVEDTGGQEDYQGKSDYHLLFLILLLSFPFSYYLIIFRYSFIGLASYLFNLLAIRYVFETALNRSGYYAVCLVAATYITSLYLYEATLLMPLYYCAVGVHFFGMNRGFDRNKLLVCFALVSFFLLAYLLSQVCFIQNQPKLMKGAAVLADSNSELGFQEQFIKKVMSLVYSFKWAFYYFGVNYRNYGTLQLVTIISIPAICTALLWQVLSRVGRGTARFNPMRQVAHGAIFFGCTFGLWSYYWIFGNRLTTPPLYALFLPALGLSLLALGLLLRYRRQLAVNSLSRAGVCAIIVLFISANLVSFLSARMSIEKSLGEARTIAAKIGEMLGRADGRYGSIVITGQSERDAYAHYFAHFEAHLKYYLSTGAAGDHPVQIVIDDRVLYKGSGAPAVSGEKLVVRLVYDPVKNELENVVGERATGSNLTAEHPAADPCQVTMLDHVLYYDAKTRGIVFRKSA